METLLSNFRNIRHKLLGIRPKRNAEGKKKFKKIKKVSNSKANKTWDHMEINYICQQSTVVEVRFSNV